MQTIVQDLKYAFRQLLAHPAFFLAAVLTLGLGLGANTAIFSLLDQALLRSLPVHDPQQLVFCGERGMHGMATPVCTAETSMWHSPTPCTRTCVTRQRPLQASSRRHQQTWASRALEARC